MGPGKEKIDALHDRMEKLGIYRQDIEEKFIKASGRGGQKVNKSAVAVYLKHRITGLSVKCGKTRSQNLNRFLALRNLVDKIEALASGGKEPSFLKQEKLKKQKRRRKRRSRKKSAGTD